MRRDTMGRDAMKRDAIRRDAMKRDTVRRRLAAWSLKLVASNWRLASGG
jgi:hypothetical protein